MTKQTKNLSELNFEELNKVLTEHKKRKIIHAALIGFSIGVLCYSIYNNGISLKPATIFPLLLLLFIFYLVNQNKTQIKEVETEIESRK